MISLSFGERAGVRGESVFFVAVVPPFEPHMSGMFWAHLPYAELFEIRCPIGSSSLRTPKHGTNGSWGVLLSFLRPVFTFLDEQERKNGALNYIDISNHLFRKK